jgi:ABC-type transport system involved in multi-copper enzyme maturation permease subunit
VNPTLVTTLWRQRLASPVRMALLAMLSGMPLLAVLFVPGTGLSPLGGAQGLLLTLGAGMIGQDVSSGVLQLLCARPVRRPEYVLSRWMGVALAGVALSVLQLALACGLLAARGALPSPQSIVLFGAGRLLECFGIAAVLALFSSLIGGLGDLAIYLLVNLGAGILQLAGQVKRWLWLDRLGAELLGALTPTIDLPRLIAASPMPWYPIVSYASTVVLCLALAIVVVNRKELSYASG